MAEFYRWKPASLRPPSPAEKPRMVWSLAEKMEPKMKLRMTENNRRRGEERRTGEKEKKKNV